MQKQKMTMKEKLAHCLMEVDLGGMNTTILDYGAVEELLETTQQQHQKDIENILELFDTEKLIKNCEPYTIPNDYIRAIRDMKKEVLNTLKE